MQIRLLEEKDLVAVSALCIDAFSVAVAPNLSHEGIDTFKNIACVDSFSDRMNQGNTILVYEKNGRLVGMIELKEGCHVAMLFVSPDCQKTGVGRELISAILSFIRSKTITVNASLNSIPAYLKYGFTCAGDPGEKFGLVYQPMELKVVQ